MPASAGTAIVRPPGNAHGGPSWTLARAPGQGRSRTKPSPATRGGCRPDNTSPCPALPGPSSCLCGRAVPCLDHDLLAAWPAESSDTETKALRRRRAAGAAAAGRGASASRAISRRGVPSRRRSSASGTHPIPSGIRRGRPSLSGITFVDAHCLMVADAPRARWRAPPRSKRDLADGAVGLRQPPEPPPIEGGRRSQSRRESVSPRAWGPRRPRG